MVDRVIRSQKDLDMLRREEDGMFYISLAGQVLSVNGSYSMTMVAANDILEKIARGQSAVISEDMAKGKKRDVLDSIKVSLQTFMVPYRTQ